MKKLLIYTSACFLIVQAQAQNNTQSQDFTKEVATAKTSYAAGKLEETHFALQQALSELDMIIGREILKLLPPKIDTAAVNTREDRVSSNTGFAGATVHRSYGKSEKVKIEIISNSPLIASLNALMNMPMMGGIVRDENNKTVKVQGYKAKLERQSAEGDQYDYTLQLPYNSALLTLTMQKCTESDIMKVAEALPIDAIAKLIQ
ncbi:MAG: hypothetical protein JNN00_19195 [Chitinophagaceae bacterium]|nr:hypothetical protein [Chitinophagaceae bacterium]